MGYLRVVLLRGRDLQLLSSSFNPTLSGHLVPALSTYNPLPLGFVCHLSVRPRPFLRNILSRCRPLQANEDVPVLGPRKRKQINYNVNAKQYNPKLVSDESDDDSEYELEEIEEAEFKVQEDGVEASGKNRKRRPRKQQVDESACPMEGQTPGQVQEVRGG